MSKLRILFICLFILSYYSPSYKNLIHAQNFPQNSVTEDSFAHLNSDLRFEIGTVQSLDRESRSVFNAFYRMDSAHAQDKITSSFRDFKTKEKALLDYFTQVTPKELIKIKAQLQKSYTISSRKLDDLKHYKFDKEQIDAVKQEQNLIMQMLYKIEDTMNMLRGDPSRGDSLPEAEIPGLDEVKIEFEKEHSVTSSKVKKE